MPEAKTYRLPELGILGRIFQWFGHAVWIAAVVFTLFFAVVAPRTAIPQRIFCLLWSCAAAIAWAAFWWVPHTITLHPGDTLEFKAVVRTRSVAIADLQSIEYETVESSDGPPSKRIVFWAPSGKIRVSADFEGIYELIAAIRSKNPGVKIRRT